MFLFQLHHCAYNRTILMFCAFVAPGVEISSENTHFNIINRHCCHIFTIKNLIGRLRNCSRRLTILILLTSVVVIFDHLKLIRRLRNRCRESTWAKRTLCTRHSRVSRIKCVVSPGGRTYWLQSASVWREQITTRPLPSSSLRPTPGIGWRSAVLVYRRY